MLYQWVVFLHILSALAFFMAHGASAVMVFQLRRERELDRIRAILDLSRAAIPVAYIAVLILLLAGIAAGIMGNWFSQGWIWASLGLMVVQFGWMYYYAYRYYPPIRKAVGLPYSDGRSEHAAEPPASAAEIDAAIRATNPPLFLGVAFGIVALILWLMVFKPF
jgi:amino acid transporter